MEEWLDQLGSSLDESTDESRRSLYLLILGLTLLLKDNRISQDDYARALDRIAEQSFRAYFSAFSIAARIQALILGKRLPVTVLEKGKKLAAEFAARSRLSAIRTIGRGSTPRTSAKIIAEASRTFSIKEATSLTAQALGNAKRKRVVRVKGVLTPRPEHQKLEGISYAINALINIDGYLVQDFRDPNLPKSSTYGCGHTVFYTR